MMMAGAQTAAPAIRCTGLSKRYREVEALIELDLAIPAGSIFGFLGRNGAGKTTTIRLMTGLAHPTAGSAWVNGVETTSADSSARRHFGYLPQDPAFYNWMNPVEYLDYVSRLFRMGPASRKRRIAELLELVDLAGVARRRIGGFSGGMVQRLGIAQALVHRPSVLFLDEPTSSLDPAGRHDILAMIERMRGQMTVFLSSHILADVERVCDTIGIIHEGRLLRVAERDELIAQYAANVVRLKLARESLASAGPFLSHLRAQAWVTGVRQQENSVRIAVTDLETARRAVLPLVVEHGLLLNRFELARPTLEEVFLQISGAKPEAE